MATLYKMTGGDCKKSSILGERLLWLYFRKVREKEFAEEFGNETV